MPYEKIYHLDCYYPEPPKKNLIEGNELPKKQQKFRTTELPDFMDDFDYDSDGEIVYTPEQSEFIFREIEKFSTGHWFMSNGRPTYITGRYYRYLNYWTLENGEQPDYRDADRRFFLFFEECYNDEIILGIQRGKKRREGATSQGSCIEVDIATRIKNARVGNISKTGTDARTMFIDMVVYGYRAQPVWLKADTESGEEVKTEMRFVKKEKRVAKKGNAAVSSKREGLNSSISYRNTALNSYDSGRWTFIMVDEGGKFPTEVPIQNYWAVVKEVLKQGAMKVGFAYLPSTVNPPNAGGENWLKLWQESDHSVHGRRTPSGLVRYFQPANDGYAGFIDEYGMSLLEEAKEHILRERSLITDPLMVEEHKRLYPLSEEEMFCFSSGDSDFNMQNIDDQLDWLKNNPQPRRRGKLFLDFEGNVQWTDDANGCWLTLSIPDQERIGFMKDGKGNVHPLNAHEGDISVDPFRSGQHTDGEGSKGVIWVLTKLDSSDSDNTGMPIAMYVGRPRLKSLFNKEILMASMFWGYKATVEADVGDDFVEFFAAHKALAMLSKTPDAVINMNRKKKSQVKYGVFSSDPFALEKQLNVAIAYIEHHCHKIKFPELLEDLKKYNHAERTKRDISVAFMIGLLAILGTRKAERMEKRKKPLLRTFTPNIFKN